MSFSDGIRAAGRLWRTGSKKEAASAVADEINRSLMSTQAHAQILIVRSNQGIDAKSLEKTRARLHRACEERVLQAMMDAR
jgi:microcystin degradation protein MlrC